jgi:hypothetical protein
VSASSPTAVDHVAFQQADTTFYIATADTRGPASGAIDCFFCLTFLGTMKVNTELFRAACRVYFLYVDVPQ